MLDNELSPDAKIFNPYCPYCKHDGLDHFDPIEHENWNYRIGCRKCGCRYYYDKQLNGYVINTSLT